MDVDLAGLLADVQQAFAAAADPVFVHQADFSDFYEVWVYCVVLRAAQEEGYGIQFLNCDGSPVATFVFRTSQGPISGPHPYSHALLTHESASPLELHQGIRVDGSSKHPHEADVCLVTDAAAAAARASGANPAQVGIRMTIECKCYAGPLPIRFLREILGLSLELGRRSTWLATNTTHDALHRILRQHSVRWEDNLTPGSAAYTRLLVTLRTEFDHAKST